MTVLAIGVASNVAAVGVLVWVRRERKRLEFLRYGAAGSQFLDSRSRLARWRGAGAIERELREIEAEPGRARGILRCARGCRAWGVGECDHGVETLVPARRLIGLDRSGG